MKTQDSEGYYAALGVSRDATREEIHLAYHFLKKKYKAGDKKLPAGKIEAAHRTLANPERRRAYDAGPATRGGLLRRADGSSRLNSGPLLVGLTVGLAFALALVLAPSLRGKLVNFEQGDRLVWRKTGKPVGTVVVFEPGHEFPDSGARPAYQIRYGQAEPIWLPATDVNAQCRSVD
jgi:curved DNA-binding protein CbpA